MRTNILKWATLAACFHAPLAAAQDEVHAWHALTGPAEQVFTAKVDQYLGDTGHSVIVSQFSSQEQLDAALQTVLASGVQPPDVLLGNHAMVPELVEHGLLSAYCLPGECPECESPNPPRWCAYASNGFYGDYYGGFEATMIPELQMTADRCLEDGCGECDRQDIFRPPYCDYVLSFGGAQLDVIQAGFAVWNDEWQWPFPIGIPVWWQYLAVAGERERLLNRYGVDLPQDVAQAQQVLSFNQGGYLLNWDGEFCGTPPRRWKAPGWVNEVMSSHDPMPIRDADLSIVPSSELGALLNEVPGLEVATLEGYRPQILVDGAFVLSTSQVRATALDFMYELGSAELQAAGVDGTTLLPAHGDAFSNTDSAIPGLREAALTGGLAPTYR